MTDIKNSKLLDSDTGIRQLKDACIVLVKTEWNDSIVDELEKGCISKLKEFGIKKIKTIIVPGAFEIGFAIKSYADHWGTKDADAFIALGCIIKGDTPHFEYVCRAVTDAVVQLNLSMSSPTIFGVLTLDNEEQGLERIGGKHGHKGEEAAITALKMIALKKSYNP